MTKQRTTQTATAAGEPQFYKVAEAAAVIRAKKWTIAAAIRQKKLPYLRVGKTYVITREDLMAYAASLRVAAIQ